MKNILKKLFRFIILIILIGLFCAFGWISYSEIQATKAKEYLIKEYDFTEFESVVDSGVLGGAKTQYRFGIPFERLLCRAGNQ